MKKNTAAKAELWADRIRDFQDSGLSHKEWCQKHEIALSTFHYWFRKLQAGSQAEASCDNLVFAKLPSEQEIHSAALLDHTRSPSSSQKRFGSKSLSVVRKA